MLLLLKAHQTNPCSWDKIIEHMKENTNSLPEDAKKLYSEASLKQLRSRLSTKFGKLLTSSTEKISNDQIKDDIRKVKEMEVKLLKKHKTPVIEKDIRDNIANALSSDDEQPGPSHNRHAAVAGPAPQQPTVVAKPDAAAKPALQQLDVIAGPVPQQPDAVAEPALQQLDAVAEPAPQQPDAVVDQIEDGADELARPHVVRPKILKAK